jgi:hypothetical protein
VLRPAIGNRAGLVSVLIFYALLPATMLLSLWKTAVFPDRAARLFAVAAPVIAAPCHATVR